MSVDNVGGAEPKTTASKLAAAFHHAGHAVAAHLSEFHALALPLRIDSYGTGEVTAALSRRKLIAANKRAEVSARADPEVATSIATILCAGLASEQIAAARRLPVKPDRERSTGDLEMARAELAHAGIGGGTQPYEEAATALLTEHWAHVQSVAERLAVAEEMAPHEIAALLASA
ncbi:MAG: hypothetical protein M3Z29_14975 [Pseudomonadota bacterium]|nr:hypothetical protein [Pseudomonadota bacterium]